MIVDQHYRTVATLKATDGWVLTLHEIVIRGNDAWVTANKNIPMNLSKYGGAYNGALIDSAVQEYDLTTGKLVRSWDALDHIPLGDSQATLPTNGFPWDAYHVNSIDVPGRRDVRGLDAQHVGRLQGEHRHRRDRVDARRQALELQARPRARTSSGSTTCRCIRARRCSRCSTTTAARSPAAAPT